MNLQHSQHLQLVRARIFAKQRSTLKSKTKIVLCPEIKGYNPKIKVIFTILHFLTLNDDIHNKMILFLTK